MENYGPFNSLHELRQALSADPLRCSQCEILDRLIQFSGVDPKKTIYLGEIKALVAAFDKLRPTCAAGLEFAGFLSIRHALRPRFAQALRLAIEVKSMPAWERLVFVHNALGLEPDVHGDKLIGIHQALQSPKHFVRLEKQEAFRKELDRLAKLLGLGDLLSYDRDERDKKHAAAQNSGLHEKPWNPQTLGEAIEYFRLLNRHTFSSLGKKTGIPDHRLQVLSSSATLITERNHRDVTQLGKIFEQEALFERLFEEAKEINKSLAHLDHATWVSTRLGQEHDLILDAEMRRKFSVRKGRGGNRKPHAHSSIKTYESRYAVVIHYLRTQALTPNGSPGPGFAEADISAYMAFELGNLGSAVAWLESIKDPGKREEQKFAKNKKVWFTRARDLNSPDGGLYRNLTYFAEHEPTVKWMRSLLEAQTTADCSREQVASMSALEVLQEGSRRTVSGCCEIIDAIDKSPPGTDRAERIQPFLQLFPLCYVGLFVFAHSVLPPETGLPPDRETAQRQMVAAIIALMMWRTLRAEELARFELKDIWIDSENRLVATFPHPEKNGDGNAGWVARNEKPMALPEVLACLIRPYITSGREAICGTGAPELFFNASRGPLTATAFSHLLDKFARTYADKLFPFGLRPHLLRDLVATDLVVRYGTYHGLPIASTILRSSEQMVEKTYVLISGSIPRRGAHEPSQIQALIDASNQAQLHLGRKPKPAKSVLHELMEQFLLQSGTSD